MSDFGTGLRAHLEGQREQAAPVDPPPPDVSAQLRERARELERAAARLRERERALEAREAFVQAEAARVELATKRLAEPPPERRYVREVLRERAEQHADALWARVEAALEAVTPDGRPDHDARLAALSFLLAQAYDADRSGAAVLRDDELRHARERRGFAQS